MDVITRLQTEIENLKRQVAELRINTGKQPKWVFPKGNGVRLGKTDEAIAKGSVGTVSEYIGAEGTEVDSTVNVECKNRFADVDTGKWVAFVKIDGFHYLIAAECD